jgi:tripeptide aminopeptidase
MEVKIMINTDRMINTFLEYIKIDSESFNEKNMCDFLSKQLMAEGFEVVINDIGAKLGSNGYNMVVKYPGDESKEPIFLSSHVDTVVPGVGIKPVINGDLITSDGTTILGGDDKAGVAIIVEVMRTVKENNLTSRPIEAIFSICEEVGLQGAKEFDLSLIKSKEGVILDSGGPIGTIITQAPAQDALSVTIHGKPAHAGVAPETGVSAIQIAAEALTNMKLYRIDEETTANFGSINGGGATNIITPLVEMKGETRSLNVDKLEKQTASMKKAFEDAAAKLGGTVDVDIVRKYNPLNVPSDANIVLELKKAFEANGCEPIITSTGGGSDTNIYYEKGLDCVNISCGMAKAHTLEEEIKISDMEKTAKSILTLVTQ